MHLLHPTSHFSRRDNRYQAPLRLHLIYTPGRSRTTYNSLSRSSRIVMMHSFIFRVSMIQELPLLVLTSSCNSQLVLCGCPVDINRYYERFIPNSVGSIAYASNLRRNGMATTPLMKPDSSVPSPTPISPIHSIVSDIHVQLANDPVPFSL